MTDKLIFAIGTAVLATGSAVIGLSVFAAHSSLPAGRPQYQYPAPHPPSPTISHFCRISPNGNRVCCLRRDPTFETWRVIDRAGFSRTYWRLYCA